MTVPLNPNVFVTNELWGLKNLFTIWAHFAKRVTLGSFFIFLFGQHKVIKASSAPIKKWRWWGSRSTSIEYKTDTTGRGRRVAVCRAAVERGGPAAVVKSPHEVKQRGQTHEIWSSRMLMTSLCLVLSFVCFLCCSVGHFFKMKDEAPSRLQRHHPDVICQQCSIFVIECNSFQVKSYGWTSIPFFLNTNFYLNPIGGKFKFTVSFHFLKIQIFLDESGGKFKFVDWPSHD